MLWKERSHFYSLKPLLPATGLLATGRVCEMLVEHPSIRLASPFDLSSATFERVLVVGSNLADTAGILFLIIGFVKIIKFERAEEKHIQDLETLLPLCSSCKKYRSNDNQWMPIEKYLIESGAPRLTHGICPECATKLYGDLLTQK